MRCTPRLKSRRTRKRRLRGRLSLQHLPDVIHPDDEQQNDHDSDRDRSPERTSRRVLKSSGSSLPLPFVGTSLQIFAPDCVISTEAASFDVSAFNPALERAPGNIKKPRGLGCVDKIFLVCVAHNSHWYVIVQLALRRQVYDGEIMVWNRRDR